MVQVALCCEAERLWNLANMPVHGVASQHA